MNYYKNNSLDQFNLIFLVWSYFYIYYDFSLRLFVIYNICNISQIFHYITIIFKKQENL